MQKEQWTCESCGGLVPAGRNDCPRCGYIEEEETQMVTRPATGMKTHSQQAVIVCRDCSPSMTGRKAREATRAVDELMAELANPVNRDGFWASVVDFAGRARVIQRMEKATQVNGRLPRIHTLLRFATSISRALMKVKNILNNPSLFPTQGIRWIRPVVVLFSDGMHNTGPSPFPVAEEVKTRADIITVAFGSNADEETLRQIATSPNHFYRCENGAELRRFMAEVGKTVTSTLSRGESATHDLAGMDF